VDCLLSFSKTKPHKYAALINPVSLAASVSVNMLYSFIQVVTISQFTGIGQIDFKNLGVI